MTVYEERRRRGNRCLFSSGRANDSSTIDPPSPQLPFDRHLRLVKGRMAVVYQPSTAKNPYGFLTHSCMDTSDAERCLISGVFRVTSSGARYCPFLQCLASIFYFKKEKINDWSDTNF